MMADTSNTPIPLLALPYTDARTQLGYHMFMDSAGHPDPMSSDLLDQFYDLTLQQAVVLDQANAGRPDNIAKMWYGDARLYWVIMAYNGATNRTQFSAGTVVRIPDKTELFALLSKMSKRTDSRSVTKVISL